MALVLVLLLMVVVVVVGRGDDRGGPGRGCGANLCAKLSMNVADRNSPCLIPYCDWPVLLPLLLPGRPYGQCSCFQSACAHSLDYRH